MIGILVPVHNEEKTLGQCLESLLKAASHPGLHKVPVDIIVVLDSCDDGSGKIAETMGMACIRTFVRNVGIARDMGACHLIRKGARWIACTDADSHVQDDWLVSQLSLGADLVCGTVRVADWSGFASDVFNRYQRHYHYGDGHRHIHGANLGFTSELYLQAGGFPPIKAHEDREFVRKCQAKGARVAWSDSPRVFTSARMTGKTPEGFAHYLRHLHRQPAGKKGVKPFLLKHQ